MLKKTTSKKFGKIILFLLMFAFIAAPLAISDIKPNAAETTVNDLQKQINDKKASMSSSASRKKELEATIASLKKQQFDAIIDKKVYDDYIAAIESEIKDTEALVETLKEYIEFTDAEINKTQEDYEKSYELFLEMIKFSYEEGDVNYLTLLLDSKNFTDFLSRVDIISNMLEYNKNVIEQLQYSKENLETIKSNHEDMINQLDGYAAELKEKVKDFEGKREEARKAVEQSSRELEKNIALQEQMNQEDKNLQAEISRLSKDLQAMQESQRKYVGGTILWPVDVKNRVISSGFGNRTSPITGRPEFHNGVDIPAPYGSNIYAVNDGTVILATYSAGYGNYIVIDHGGGITTMYAHCSSLIKSVGAKVQKGDVIAKIGSTGWSTGNHLHFGYAENGVFKNPLSNGLVKP